jgi:hypothetical protein
MGYKDKEKQKYFQRIWKRQQNLRAKLKAVEILGGKCIIDDCDISDFRCLQIDHIIPIIRGKRGTIGGIESSYKIIRGTLTNKEVQLLCANHHAIKTYEKDRLTFKNYIVTPPK